jgi:small subunit ribosomal protein S4e
MTMGKKGNTRHMKCLNAPRFFNIHRKENKYVAKPRAGRHKLDRAISLSLLLAKTASARNMDEAKRMLSARSVLVNGRIVKDSKYAVGLNDIIEIASEGKYYRIDIDSQGHVVPAAVDKPDSANLYKVLGKYKVRGGNLMLRLHDGSVVVGSADISVSDSVMVDNSRKIVSHLKMDTGAKCRVIDGAHVGTHGAIKELVKGGMNKDSSVIIEQKDGSTFQTPVRNIMVTK